MSTFIWSIHPPTLPMIIFSITVRKKQLWQLPPLYSPHIRVKSVILWGRVFLFFSREEQIMEMLFGCALMCQWSFTCFLFFTYSPYSVLFFLLLVTASLTCLLRLHPMHSSACLIISLPISKNCCFKVIQHWMKMMENWSDYSCASLLSSSK